MITTWSARGLVTMLALTAMGCDSSVDPVSGSCSYGGKNHSSGESFPATDGCNTCRCEADGTVACTLAACLHDAGFVPPDSAAPGDSAELRDAAPACRRGDTIIPAGQSVHDGCNACVCSEQGVLSCTGRVCTVDPPADAGAACTLPGTLTFGWNGGMVMYQDENVLDPKGGLSITRSYYGRGAVDGAAVRSCAPALPACGASGVVSLSTIIADLAASDVQAALASGKGTLYGVDSRPVDGAVWSIALASGGSILVGSPCSSSSRDTCVPIPAGVQRLADDLKSLVAAALATVECSGL